MGNTNWFRGIYQLGAASKTGITEVPKLDLKISFQLLTLHAILASNRKGKRPLGRPSCRWETIKIDVT
jgi:hypothetical protein